MIKNLMIVLMACDFTHHWIGYLVVGGAVVNRVLTEPRAPLNVGYDQIINHQISKKLSHDPHFEENANVRVTSYNQIVLLTGQAHDEILRQKAEYYAKQTSKVKRVFNQVSLAQSVSAWQRIQDVLLTEVIQCRLIMTSYLTSHAFKITTENGTVFIQGKANSEQADLVTSTVQKTWGVKKVVRLIEVV